MSSQAPPPKRDSYAAALDLARREWTRKDPRVAAEAAGAEFDRLDRTVTVELFGSRVRADAEGCVTALPAGDTAPTVEAILVLHHLATATGAPLSGRPAAFRELPGGAFYRATFDAHTVVALIRAFGNDAARFEKVCRGMGASPEEGSGVRMRFQAFPRVPVTLCYWAGEEEMPPGAQVLFDASVLSYLPLEDVAVLGETLAHRVVEAAGGGNTVALYQYGQ